MTVGVTIDSKENHNAPRQTKRRIEARLARIEKIANAFRIITRLTTLEIQLRARVAKTTANWSKSQNNGLKECNEITKLL